MRGAWLGFGVLLAVSGVLAAPPVIPDVPAREIEVTAGMGDVSAPDRGLVALSDGSGAATLLVREAGHLRSQRSSDGGATWLPEVEVSTASSQPVLDHKAVLAADGAVVAVWAAPDPAGDRALYLSRSGDHGASWSPPVPVAQEASRFSLAVSGEGRTAIVWVKGGTQSVHARVSGDGTTWPPPATVYPGQASGGAEIQSLDLGLGTGGAVHVSFVERRGNSSYHLFTSRSLDEGSTFEPCQEQMDFAWNVDLEVDDDGTVLVAFTSVRFGSRVGLLRSTDGGATFTFTTPLPLRGANLTVFPMVTAWPGTSDVVLRCVEGQGRYVFGISNDSGETFAPWFAGTAVQNGATGTAVARTPGGRLLFSWLDRGELVVPPVPPGLYVASFDGAAWKTGRADGTGGRFQRVSVTTGLTVGAQGAVTAVWEDPRPDPGTTSIWNASAPSDTMQFGPPARVDGDAFTSRPNAFTDPTLAAEGGGHVMAVFLAAARSEQNDLFAAMSSDRGRTFAPPVLLATDAPGTTNYTSPAATVGSEGVGWVLSGAGGSGLRLFRTGDFGGTFPEPAINLGSSVSLVQVAIAAGGIGLATWTSGSGVWLARGGGPGTPVAQTMLSGTSFEVAVCADGPSVTVAYDAGTSLVGRRSSDGGATFGPAVPLTLPSEYPQYIDLACAGDQATAAWFGRDAVRTASLGPNGWTQATTLGPSSFAVARVVRTGSTVVVGWDGEGKVWIARSMDGGVSWAPAARVDETRADGYDPDSWNPALAADSEGRFWIFWEERLGSEGSIVVRRSEGGLTWNGMRRLSREQPQHAFPRHGYPYNARAGTMPGAALLAYSGPLSSDWRSVFVNADDALDGDRDGYPDTEDCAADDPDVHTCSRPPVAAAGEDRTVECTGNLGAVVHLDGTGSSDPDGDLASYLWTEAGSMLAETAIADVMLGLGTHTVTLQVTDAAGGSGADDLAVEIADTQPPSGEITFPAAGACFGPAQVPVILQEDAADVCDPAPERVVTPGVSFETHGDHLATLRVQDAAGLLLESTVGFTIDTVPPLAGFASNSGRIDPGHLPLVVTVTGSDEDGASGGVLHERLYLNGCLALDGNLEGDGDGLLSDETLSLGIGDLCSLAARCGLAVLSRPELRLEAVDCAGNVGSASTRLDGAFPLGVCRSPRAQRAGESERAVSLRRR
ncbi:MAG TPA: hypothetical protein VFO11_01480 [Candidatus Polarisedimenticolaceae bacterium]|nr:hypothetical protein [Candidatus Polarisedimenticolaceae bacterium]